ncbi:tRNA (cytidine(56)-2'-O)-methyltransferase [Thermogladius sp. 4427co]|uniref:tRNA (cytidine(56)-2'-O)-methyltransferase n=1 Tax=Thermogladius sp. 4427co TaxID=3450718 RepID=UPI003F79BC91
MVDIYVLRLGHRPGRDKRITTHVGLVARAFGARGFILGDVYDEKVVSSLKKVVELWGGPFDIIAGVNSVEYVRNWKSRGIVVHLTMYGLHIDDVIEDIRSINKDILVVVGAEKVPRVFYELADYNVAIGHQPHSEVAALAVFLDRYYKGGELHRNFSGAKQVILPSPRGKKVLRIGDEERGSEREKTGYSINAYKTNSREDDGRGRQESSRIHAF